MYLRWSPLIIVIAFFLRNNPCLGQFVEALQINEQIDRHLRETFNKDRDDFFLSLSSQIFQKSESYFNQLELNGEQKLSFLKAIAQSFKKPPKMIFSLYAKKNRSISQKELLILPSSHPFHILLPKDDLGFQDYFLELYEVEEQSYTQLISMLWKLTPQGWKILILDKSPIKFLGQDRNQWFHKIESYFSKGLDYIVRVTLGPILKLAEPKLVLVFHDAFEQKINQIKTRAAKIDMNKYLPIESQEIKIFQVVPIYFEGEKDVYLNFRYYGREENSVKNIKKLQSEAKELMPIVEKKFPGLLNAQDYIYFTSVDPKGKNYDHTMKFKTSKNTR